MDWEFAVLDWIRSTLHTRWGNGLWPAVSALGNAGAVWIALAVVLLCRKKTRRLGLCLKAALVLDLLSCNLLLKPLVGRPRPFAMDPTLVPLIPLPTDASFPSGHTASSFAAFSALLFGKSRLWIPALALACAIAFSRLYLLVHFPTDVLAGAVLGIACGFAGVKLINAIKKPHA